MVHEGLWEQLIKLERPKTAKRANCRYFSEPERYLVFFLNTNYVVNLSERQIFSSRADSPEVPAGFLEQLCVLCYLINAQDLPLAKKLVKPEALPSGQFFFRGLHRLPTDKLEKAFGACPEDIYRIAEQFAGERCDLGDASIELNMFPRVPITIVIWGSDDEFGSRASILFDQTASAHLPLDALLAAVDIAVGAIVKASAESS